MTFVAKTGVRNTFFVGFMASLQRTLYVDYNRAQDAKRTSDEMAKRLVDATAPCCSSPKAIAISARTCSRSARRWSARRRRRWTRAAPRMWRSSRSPSPTPICRACRCRATSARGISGMNARGFRQMVDEPPHRRASRTSPSPSARPIPLEPDTDRKVVTKLAENQVRRMLVALNRHERSCRRWRARLAGLALVGDAELIALGVAQHRETGVLVPEGRAKCGQPRHFRRPVCRVEVEMDAVALEPGPVPPLAADEWVQVPSISTKGIGFRRKPLGSEAGRSSSSGGRTA